MLQCTDSVHETFGPKTLKPGERTIMGNLSAPANVPLSLARIRGDSLSTTNWGIVTLSIERENGAILYRMEVAARTRLNWRPPGGMAPIIPAGSHLVIAAQSTVELEYVVTATHDPLV